MTQNFAFVRGSVQHYQWGGYHYIPNLLGQQEPAEKPCAEYWLGTHTNAPSSVVTDPATTESLETFLQQRQAPAIQFLLKILDVREMLSIQCHPSKEQAQSGFARENQQGIPLTASHRNYKDPQPKPELMVALSDFWLLHGIKSTQDIESTLRQYPALIPVADHLTRYGLAETLRFVLTPSTKLDEIVELLTKADVTRTPSTDKSDIMYWVQRWTNLNPNMSQGLLTLFFLNVVHLKPGEAIYQPPGLLHAYLEGQNVELMGNSDNVMRAGLTPKHIDVDELLSIGHLQDSPTNDFIITPRITATGFETFPTPFHDFELSGLSGTDGSITWRVEHTTLLLCLEGEASFSDNESTPILSKGDCLVLLPGQCYSLEWRGHLRCILANNL